MRKRPTIWIILIAGILLTGMPVLAQEKVEEKVEEKDTIERTSYIYEATGHRDPFVSILEALARKQSQKKKGLFPIEDFDLSQIRVIAIMSDVKDNYALVGLPDGKFYTIKEGMTIGIHEGTVHSILEDMVLIREFKPDFRGQMRPEDTYLRLRKEEGQ
jgi:Tfp pilus assembly protein PilP